MQDARTPSAQLHDLLGKFEDFHTQCECEWVKVSKLSLWRHSFLSNKPLESNKKSCMLKKEK